MKFLDKLNRIVFGYDFFISYCRKDASNYASNLATEIIKQGYSCYLDQWGSDPGKKLPLRLKSNIKSSSVFILLASNEALQSNPINQEIDIFLTTKRVIIPVDLGNIYEAVWFPKIEGIAIADEKNEFITTKKSSTKLLERIQNSFIYLKQSKRIRYSGLSAILLIIISLIVSFYMNVKIKEMDVIIEDKNNVIKDKNVENEKRKNDLLKSEGKLLFQRDSLNRIDEELKLKRNELDEAIERQKAAKALAEKFESQANNYFTIANEANSNGKKLFLELQELCFNEYKQPDLIDKNHNPNLNHSQTVFFEFDKHNLSKEGMLLLDSLSGILKEYPNYKVKIEARMSIQWLTKSELMNDVIKTELKKQDISAGGLKYYYSNAYSMAVCDRRAKSIASWLMKNGVEPPRILISAYGNITPDKKTMKDYMGDRADIYLVAEN